MEIETSRFAREGRVFTRAIAAAAIMAVSFATAAFCSAAGATTFGQVGAWGTPGSAAGQLFDPGMLGVDPEDGSVYTGEETPDEEHFRVQKFTASGEFKAKVELPGILKEGKEEKTLTLHGIAVDPVLHRVYLIEGCLLGKPAVSSCKKPPNIVENFGARRILVFSTEPSGTALIPASPAMLPLPEGKEALYQPQSIAVDPSTHDLVIFGEDAEEHPVVQRISSAGVAGVRFVDKEFKLAPFNKEAHAIAVGPDGTTYVLTGSPNSAGSKSTRAWQLPKNLSSLEKVPGFAEAAENEGWATGLFDPKSSPLIGGPQLAISPDGKTLYWKEALQQAGENEAEEEERDNVLIRGYSLEKSTTSVLYGNGKASCRIQTGGAGLATTAGEKVVVFDYGPEGPSPEYGDKIFTFGPGGSGCRIPTGKFSVNGDKGEAAVSVEAGKSIPFDAAESELVGATPKELIWEFGDGTEKEKVVGSGEEPAKTSTSHKYTSPGTYTVTLKMKLTAPKNPVTEEPEPTGDPLPVTRTVKVTAGTLNALSVEIKPPGSGTVTSAPAGISCGQDCEEAYPKDEEVTLTQAAATGFEFLKWVGCDSESAGKCKVKMSTVRKVVAEFKAKPKFKLTVKVSGSGSGTVKATGISCPGDCEQEFVQGEEVTLSQSSASGSEFKGWGGACAGTGACKVAMSKAQEVTAAFDPIPPKEEGGGGGGSGGGGSTPPPPPPVENSPPVTKKPLTPKQKALAKCKRLKGKARAKCIKKANSIGKHKHRRRAPRGRG
ncbi:MAG TPA: PKD domain-containing protein [Solirubrobacterales bacterium]|nr:PKD domain-containing protein [Solirubrobacterales bacterium]